MKAVQGLDMILFQQVAHPPGAVLQKETQAGRVLLAAVGTHSNPVISKIRITRTISRVLPREMEEQTIGE